MSILNSNFYNCRDMLNVKHPDTANIVSQEYEGTTSTKTVYGPRESIEHKPSSLNQVQGVCFLYPSCFIFLECPDMLSV